MNLGEAKTKALMIMDEYSTNGLLTPTAENVDFTVRMNQSADMAQKEIATVKKINAVYTITRNAIANQILNGFDMLQHLDTDLSDDSATGSKSYYFEVDGQCTVTIEEEIATVWTVLETITVPNTVLSFTDYRGLITASSVDNDIRIKFSGSYTYNIRNRALYAYTFPTDDDVPEYKPFVKYPMPANFLELKKVILETDTYQINERSSFGTDIARFRMIGITQRYQQMKDYRWEGKKTFVIRYDYTGSIDIEYYKNPATIPAAPIDDADSYDSTEFEVDAETQEWIPYYMAAEAYLKEDAQASVMIMNKYLTKISNALPNDNENEPQVPNKMGW